MEKKILVVTKDEKKLNRYVEEAENYFGLKKGEYEGICASSFKEAEKFLYKLDENEQVVKAVDLVVTPFNEGYDTQEWDNFASQLTGVLTGIRIPHLGTSLS